MIGFLNRLVGRRKATSQLPPSIEAILSAISAHPRGADDETGQTRVMLMHAGSTVTAWMHGAGTRERLSAWYGDCLNSAQLERAYTVLDAKVQVALGASSAPARSPRKTFANSW